MLKVFIAVAVTLALSCHAQAQDNAGGANALLALMREAWAHASTHGATERPVLSPAFADVLSSAVPMAELHHEGFEVLPGTTSDENTLRALIQAGADGIITDRPDILQRIVAAELTSTSDPRQVARLKRFDVQGHRGARGLRPESTLPAFEEALDLDITTIELDNGITSDKVPMIWHDQFLNPRSCRRADGAAYTGKNRVYFFDVSRTNLQKTYICDKLYFGPDQKNDPALSPVAVAFAKQEGLISPYVPTYLDQLFRFVRFYAEYYRSGPGRHNPDAPRHVEAAGKIRFNIETKLIPEYLPKVVGHQTVMARTSNRTAAPQDFVDAIAGVITRNRMESRCEIESFDFRTLHLFEEQFPKLRTYYLTGNPRLFPGTATAAVNLLSRNPRDAPLGNLALKQSHHRAETRFPEQK